MRNGRRALPGALMLVLVASCASQETDVEWERVESPHYVSPEWGFALELPAGWMRSGQVLVRDLDGRNVISFNAGPVLRDEDALTVDASAPGLVQAMREQLASLPGVQVLEFRSVTLDGLPGFRAHYVRAPGELPDDPSAGPAAKREHVLYGAIDGEMLYAFALEAPAGADFVQDLPDFEVLVSSFRRTGSADGPSLAPTSRP